MSNNERKNISVGIIIKKHDSEKDHTSTTTSSLITTRHRSLTDMIDPYGGTYDFEYGDAGEYDGYDNDEEYDGYDNEEYYDGGGGDPFGDNPEDYKEFLDESEAEDEFDIFDLDEKMDGFNYFDGEDTNPYNQTNTTTTIEPYNYGQEQTLTPSSSTGSKKASKGFGFFTLTFFFLIGIFILWYLYQNYKRRREQKLMDIRSAQADRVLGDMQMVPNADLDDNEIL